MQTSDVPSFFEILRMAMRLNPWVYSAVQESPVGIWIALAVVGLAAVSEALGQSVVLFINKVRPRRFLLALGISTASQMVAFVIWATSVWLVSTYVFGANQAYVAVMAAVGLAYAPQVLAFFELTPFLGNTFAVILSLWSMIAIVVAIDIGTGLATWQAIVTSGLGWILIQIWRRSIGRPIYALGNWMKRRAAGNPLVLTLQDISSLRHASDLVENWENWRERISRSKIAELSQTTLAELSQRFDLPGMSGDEKKSDSSKQGSDTASKGSEQP